MLGYMLEWLILMLLVALVYKFFGKVFEKEDVYLFTVVMIKVLEGEIQWTKNN